MKYLHFVFLTFCMLVIGTAAVAEAPESKNRSSKAAEELRGILTSPAGQSRWALATSPLANGLSQNELKVIFGVDTASDLKALSALWTRQKSLLATDSDLNSQRVSTILFLSLSGMLKAYSDAPNLVRSPFASDILPSFAMLSDPQAVKAFLRVYDDFMKGKTGVALFDEEDLTVVRFIAEKIESFGFTPAEKRGLLDVIAFDPAALSKYVTVILSRPEPGPAMVRFFKFFISYQKFKGGEVNDAMGGLLEPLFRRFLDGKPEMQGVIASLAGELGPMIDAKNRFRLEFLFADATLPAATTKEKVILSAFFIDVGTSGLKGLLELNPDKWAVWVTSAFSYFKANDSATFKALAQSIDLEFFIVSNLLKPVSPMGLDGLLAILADGKPVYKMLGELYGPNGPASRDKDSWRAAIRLFPDFFTLRCVTGSYFSSQLAAADLAVWPGMLTAVMAIYDQAAVYRLSYLAAPGDGFPGFYFRYRAALPVMGYSDLSGDFRKKRKAVNPDLQNSRQEFLFSLTAYLIKKGKAADSGFDGLGVQDPAALRSFLAATVPDSDLVQLIKEEGSDFLFQPSCPLVLSWLKADDKTAAALETAMSGRLERPLEKIKLLKKSRLKDVVFGTDRPKDGLSLDPVLFVNYTACLWEESEAQVGFPAPTSENVAGLLDMLAVSVYFFDASRLSNLAWDQTFTYRLGTSLLAYIEKNPTVREKPQVKDSLERFRIGDKNDWIDDRSSLYKKFSGQYAEIIRECLDLFN